MKINLSFLNNPIYNIEDWYLKYDESEESNNETRDIVLRPKEYYLNELIRGWTPAAVTQLKKMKFKFNKLPNAPHRLTCIPNGSEIFVTDISHFDHGTDNPQQLRASIRVNLAKPVLMRRLKYIAITFNVDALDLKNKEWSDEKIKPQDQKSFQYHRFGGIA